MVPAVRVVILNFNGGDDVLRSVEHALALDWPEDRFEVVVVDNASTDRSPQRIESRFPAARVVYNASNTGFPANNLAMADIDDFAYVALINPDAFVEPGWLAALVDSIEGDEHIGAACPRMLLAPRFTDVAISCVTHRAARDDRDLGVRISGLSIEGADRLAHLLPVDGIWGAETSRSSDGSVSGYHWTSGDAVVGLPIIDADEPVEIMLRLDAPVPKVVTVGGVDHAIGTSPTWVGAGKTGAVYDVVNNAGSILVEGGWGADRGLGDPDDGRYDEPCDVFAWCGGGVLLRAEYLRDVGLFDEDFFLYYEDTDLSWRGGGRGWRYRYAPDARMRHLHGTSTVIGSPLFVYYVERNRLLMLVKNAPAAFAFTATASYLKATLGVAREQILRPLMAGRRPDLRTTLVRTRAFLGVLRALPTTLQKRRAVRRAMRVSDLELLRWQVPQP